LIINLTSIDRVEAVEAHGNSMLAVYFAGGGSTVLTVADARAREKRLIGLSPTMNVFVF
jgi:hypothetical protein